MEFLALLASSDIDLWFGFQHLTVVDAPPYVTWYVLIGTAATTTPFVLFHLYLILKNRTTLEFFATLTRRTAAADTASSFDQGYASNWKQVFGNTPTDWLVPTVDLASKTKYVVKTQRLDV